MDKAVAVILLVVVSGCTFMQKPDVAVGIPCNSGPIILDPGDHLTAQTARQIVTLNRAGAELCGWKKPTSTKGK